MRVSHWPQYKEYNSKGEDEDTVTVRKAWDNMMVQQVGCAAKICVKEGMSVQMLTVLIFFFLIKIMFFIIKIQE